MKNTEEIRDASVIHRPFDYFGSQSVQPFALKRHANLHLMIRISHMLQYFMKIPHILQYYAQL